MTNKDRKLSAMDAADALDSTALLYAVQQPATNPKSVKLTFEAFTNWHGGLLKAGGTMTGNLTLAGAPTVDLHAATKAYVDAAGSTASAALAAAVATLEAADAALDSAKLAKASNLSDLVSASSARTNLGLSANGSSLVTATDYAAMKVLLSLGEVDNTSDLNKPISTATQAALDAKQTLDADLTALAGLVSAGLLARTGAGTAAARTLTGTANEVAVTNGDGVAGAPTFSLPAALTFTGKTVTGGTFSGATLSGATTLPGSGQIDSGGNVGIGATPWTNLSVNGTTGVAIANGSNKGRLIFGDPADSTGYVGVYRAAAIAPATGGNYLNLGGYDGIAFSTGAANLASQTERMRISSAGDVGIGTAAPNGRLSVQKSTLAGNTALDIINSAAANTSNKSVLRFSTAVDYVGYEHLAPYVGGYMENAGNLASGLVFGTYTGGSLVERLRVSAGGYFGFNCASVTGIDMRIQAPGTSDAGLDIARASSTAVAVAGYDRTNTLHCDVYWGAKQHIWQISGTATMYLDASGNLGVGIAPSGAKLHVSGAAAAGAVGFKIANTEATGFASLEFNDGTNTKGQIWCGNSSYASYGGAGSLNYSANSGPHVWYNNYTERMRLTAAGDLGLGTASPGDKLHVEGNIYLGTSSRTIYTAGSGNLLFQNNTGNFIFSGANGASEWMRLDASGNLGIGATPTAKIDINSDILRLRTAKTPASASDTGNAGDICWDADYLYVCIAANTWRRVAHATW